MATIGGQYFKITDVYATILAIRIEMNIIVGIPVDGRVSIFITAPIVLDIKRTSCWQADTELAVFDRQYQTITAVHEVFDAVDTTAKIIGCLLPLLFEIVGNPELYLHRCQYGSTCIECDAAVEIRIWVYFVRIE